MVEFERVIDVPDDELDDFVEAMDEDGETIIINLDPSVDVSSWEHLDYEVL
jgi:hypothetical protein